MTEGESRDARAVDPIREAARQELAAAMRRIALDPDGTGTGASGPSAPPSPPAGAERTVPAPHGAPPPAVARPSSAEPGRGGAPRGATVSEGGAARATQRAAFDRQFDRAFPALSRAAPKPAPRPSAPSGTAQPPCLQPRQLTAARLLLAGRRVSDVAAQLKIDRHTLRDWMKDPAFQREVRRMAVELPLDELVKGARHP